MLLGAEGIVGAQQIYGTIFCGAKLSLNFHNNSMETSSIVGAKTLPKSVGVCVERSLC